MHRAVFSLLLYVFFLFFTSFVFVSVLKCVTQFLKQWNLFEIFIGFFVCFVLLTFIVLLFLFSVQSSPLLFYTIVCWCFSCFVCFFLKIKFCNSIDTRSLSPVFVCVCCYYVTFFYFVIVSYRLKSTVYAL